MVYKRFIRKNGRLHGPYYYESYRDGDSVKKRYIGTKLPNKKSVALQFFIIILACFVIANFAYLTFTGKTIVEETKNIVEQMVVGESNATEVIADNNANLQSEQENTASNLNEYNGGTTSSLESNKSSIFNDTGSQTAINNQTPENATFFNVTNNGSNESNLTIGNETLDIMGNETSTLIIESNISNSSIKLIQDIPTIRIAQNASYVLDLNNYFENALNYSLSASNIISELSGNLMSLSPENGFKGARKAKINGYNGNESLESNEFNILVSSGNINIITLRNKIKVGEPVKWIKNISFVNPEKLTIELPSNAKNISVVKVEEGVEKKSNAEIRGITGSAISESENKGLIYWISNLFSSLFKRITGFSLLDSSNSTNNSANVEVTLKENATSYLVEYYTPAPEAFEENLTFGKRITISALSELNYTDVIAHTGLDNRVLVKDQFKIKLYWYNYDAENESIKNVEDVAEQTLIEETSGAINETETANKSLKNFISNKSPVKQEVTFDAYDLNSDGFIDYVEWVVPHLSNQTYEIIYITKAQHLDSNRTFISDIYDSVKALDNNWSEVIGNGEYVRVSFESNLTNQNDITIFARGNNSEIEVYTENGNDVIASFENISDEEWHKIYLSNLSENESYGTFDLKVLGNIELDYIFDPTYTLDTNPVYACGAITFSGVYSMNQSILNENVLPDAGTSGCIDIQAENVTLNCAGYSIYNTSLTVPGVYSKYKNTTVRNCNITTGNTMIFNSAIKLDSANASFVINNTLNTQYYGIYAAGYNLSIENNTINGNAIGIYLTGGVNGMIYNNTASSNIYAVYIYGGTLNKITRNTANSNSQNGIYIQNSNNNTLINNTANSNSQNGIYLESSHNNNLDANIGSGTSSGSGIALEGSNRNNITNNIANSNDIFGIKLSSSEYNVIHNNTANSNGASSGSGIYLFGSNNNNVTSTMASSGSGYGIRLYSSGSNKIENSVLTAPNDCLQFDSSSNSNLAINNTISSCGEGLGIFSSNSNQAINNTIKSSGSTGGLQINDGAQNIIVNNNISGTAGGNDLVIVSTSNQNYNNTITSNNLVSSNKKVYYNYSISNADFNLTTTSSAGIVYCPLCNNITIQDLNLSAGNSRGVLFYKTYNSKIINSTINSNNYGIDVGTSDNTSIINTTTSFSLAYGIYISDSVNVSIKGGTINNNTQSGIYIGAVSPERTSGILIQNTILNDNGYNAINVIAQNVTIDGVTIKATSGAFSGVNSNRANTTVINSNITMKNAAGGYGILLNNADRSYILNNTLIGQYYGLYLTQGTSEATMLNNTINLNSVNIYISSSSNNTFVNNNLWNATTTSTSEGSIYLSSSNNNNFTFGLVNVSKSNIIYATGSKNLTFTNVILRGASKNDTFLTATSNATFLNSTYNESLEWVASGSQLIRKIYLNVNVTRSAAKTPINNALVNVRNSSGTVLASSTTPASGLISFGSITKYTRNGTAIFYNAFDTQTIFTPFTTKVLSISSNTSESQSIGLEYGTYVVDTPQTLHDIFANVNDSNGFANISDASRPCRYIANFSINVTNQLNIDSCTMEILPYNNYDRTISISGTGALILNYSNMTSRNTYPYYFYAERGSSIIINNSFIGYAGNSLNPYQQGISINSSSLVFNNNTVTLGYSGVVLLAPNLTISNSRIRNSAYENGLANLHVYASGARIEDSNISEVSAGGGDIIIENNADLTVVNSNYTSISFASGLNAYIKRNWYYQLYVNDSFGAGIAGVNVTAYNISNHYVTNLTTNASGLTNKGELVQYSQNSSGFKSNYSNYTVFVDNARYYNNYSFNFLGNRLSDVITLSNTAPVLGTVASQFYACESSAFTQSFTVINYDSDTLTLSLSSTNPFFLSVSSISGKSSSSVDLFSGVLTKSHVANYSKVLNVSDDGTQILSDSRLFNISVIETNNAPSIETIGDKEVTAGSLFSYQIPVSDIEDGNYNSGNLSFNLTFLSGTFFFNTSSSGSVKVTTSCSNI